MKTPSERMAKRKGCWHENGATREMIKVVADKNGSEVMMMMMMSGGEEVRKHSRSLACRGS